jgi:hypothetical protein
MFLFKCAIIAAAASLVLPIVTLSIGESTSTAHVGSRGAFGTLYVGLYTTQFMSYPTGGFVTCNFPTENDLLQVKNEYCDIAQVTYPTLLSLLALCAALNSYEPAWWISLLTMLTLMGLWGVAVAILAMAMDKNTYINADYDNSPQLSFGGGTLIFFLLALSLLALTSLFGKSSRAYLPIAKYLQDTAL